MYKIIACDLDETLLNSQRKVSQENIQAIRRAREAGVRFVPTTGRGYRSVEGTLRELGLYDAAGEYVISFNGGAITENKGNRLLRFDGIPFELAREIVSRGRTYNVCIHAYTKDTVYVYNFVESERAYLEGRMAVTVIDTPSIDFLEGQDIAKVLFMNEDEAYRLQIEKDLQDITGDLDVSYSSNRYIEFNHRGVDKGHGLLALARLLGVPREQTIAIGDNFNDLPMLQAAGLGVGVQNAVPGIRAECSYITAATNDESAIAEVINRFIFGAP